MKLYLWQSIYPDESCESLVLHVPNTDIWIHSPFTDGSSVEVLQFPDYFWKCNGITELLAEIGEF